MARSRILKPGFFCNEQLSELPFEDRLCFAGLWTLADRDGRLEDRPKRIKAALFPWDDVDMPAMLSSLAALGFIDRYTVGDVAIIQVVSFAKHQNPHTREQSSELPAKTQSPEKAVPSPEKAVPCHGKAGSGRAVSTSTSTSTSVSNAVAAAEPSAFDVFWDAYPRKVGKPKAESAFRKANPSGPVLEAMLVAIVTQKRSAQWTRDGGEFIPHPATWLNQRRWEDELPKAAQTLSYQPEAHEAYDRWPEECRRLHDGECGNYQTHQIRLMRDARPS